MVHLWKVISGGVLIRLMAVWLDVPTDAGVGKTVSILLKECRVPSGSPPFRMSRGQPLDLSSFRIRGTLHLWICQKYRPAACKAGCIKSLHPGVWNPQGMPAALVEAAGGDEVLPLGVLTRCAPRGQRGRTRAHAGVKRG